MRPVFAGDDRFGSKLPVDLEIGIVPAAEFRTGYLPAPVPESPNLSGGSKNTIPGPLKDFPAATSTLLRNRVIGTFVIPATSAGGLVRLSDLWIPIFPTWVRIAMGVAACSISTPAHSTRSQ